MKLETLGWNDHFEQQTRQLDLKNVVPGRVAADIKNHLRLLTADGEVQARSSGRMFHHAAGKSDLPVVGDWVLFRPGSGPEPLARVVAVLPRTSLFVRKIPGRATREQPVAANIDTVFLITGLDANFNLRRIERYLALAWESGARPIILLNKADLVDDVDEKQAATEEIAIDVPVYCLSALYQDGLGPLMEHLKPGNTAAMLGSSGVGKSTLLNALVGEEIQKTREIGAVGKGVHTTRTREMFILPNESLLIDTPGMREIQLWSVDEGIDDAFPDIHELSVDCRFDDCSHEHEPECAVRAAVEAGKLHAKRYENYLRMQREMQELESRQDTKMLLERKAADKRLHKMARRLQKNNKKNEL